jgi:hypothetical protein
MPRHSIEHDRLLRAVKASRCETVAGAYSIRKIFHLSG